MQNILQKYALTTSPNESLVYAPHSEMLQVRKLQERSFDERTNSKETLHEILSTSKSEESL
jgi:hypothetical protein